MDPRHRRHPRRRPARADRLSPFALKGIGRSHCQTSSPARLRLSLCQAIGFYLESTGHASADLDVLRKPKLKFDFFLAHGVKHTRFDDALADPLSRGFLPPRGSWRASLARIWICEPNRVARSILFSTRRTIWREDSSACCRNHRGFFAYSACALGRGATGFPARGRAPCASLHAPSAVIFETTDSRTKRFHAQPGYARCGSRRRP